MDPSCRSLLFFLQTVNLCLYCGGWPGSISFVRVAPSTGLYQGGSGGRHGGSDAPDEQEF